MCRFNLKAKGFRSDVHSENVSAVHVIKWAKQTKLRPNKIRRVSEVIRWIHKSCSDFYYRSSEIKTGWQPLLAGVQRSLMSHIVLLTCYFDSPTFFLLGLAYLQYGRPDSTFHLFQVRQLLTGKHFHAYVKLRNAVSQTVPLIRRWFAQNEADSGRFSETCLICSLPCNVRGERGSF